MSTVVEFPARDSFDQTVAANIRAEAARVGVTQVMLANHLGISQSGVSARFKGRVEWSLREVEAVARFLGTTTSVLCAIRDSNPGPAD